MWWHELKWPQVAQLNRNLPVVVPLGSIEQHGPHLPLFVDTIQVDAIARLAERELAESAVFLPVQWLGCSEHHADFAGTISAPASIYSGVIKSIVQSILRAGFYRIFLLNGHGGNEVPAAQAMIELTTEAPAADAAHLVLASWWHVAAPKITREMIGMESEAISHACEYETSLMLYLQPGLVEMSKASDVLPAIKTEMIDSNYGGRATMFKRFHRLTATGAMGQPTAASADKGEKLLQAVVNEVSAFVRDFSKWPMLEPRQRGFAVPNASS